MLPVTEIVHVPVVQAFCAHHRRWQGQQQGRQCGDERCQVFTMCFILRGGGYPTGHEIFLVQLARRMALDNRPAGLNGKRIVETP